MPQLLTDAIEAHARTRSDSRALCQGQSRLTYSQLRDAVRRRIDWLTAKDVAGTRALFRTSGSIDDVVTWLALGAIDAGPLVVDSGVTDRELAEIERIFAPGVVITGTAITERRARSREGSDQRFFLATSGIAGFPKIVAIDREAGTQIAGAFAAHIGLSPADVVLCTTPVSHSYGLCVGLIGPLITGSTIALANGPITARAIHTAIRRHGVSVIQSVPFYYRLLLQFPLERLERVRLCISAGESLAADTHRAWTEHFAPPLCNHYGASEVGQVSIDLDGIGDSVGRPIAGCQVEVRPATDGEADAGDGSAVSGRLWVRASGPPSYYIGDTAGRSPTDGDGWFDTGDVGFFDDVGCLTIQGRASGRINVAGRKVDRAEVEQAIRCFPGVVDCAVVGRASRLSGEQVLAFVQAESIDEAAIKGFLTSRLSGFKIPSIIRRIDAVPRTRSGKIRYGLLPA